MTKQEWLALFKHPEWQKKRLKIFERDDFACQLCGTDESTLNVHHTFYWDKEDEVFPWEYSDESLVTVCDECHKGEHERLYNSRMNLIRCMSDSGLGTSDSINRLADGFEFSIGRFDEFEADVLAFGIKLLLTSRSVYHGSSTKEANALYDKRLAEISGELWSIVRERFVKGLKQPTKLKEAK